MQLRLIGLAVLTVVLLAACDNNMKGYEPSGNPSPNASAIAGLPPSGGTALVEICSRSGTPNGGTDFVTAIGPTSSHSSPEGYKDVNVLTVAYHFDADGKVRITSSGTASVGRSSWPKIIRCAA